MISTKAIIEKGALIGSNVTIEPYVFVSKNAKIGDGVILHQGARVCGDTHISDNTVVYSYSVLGSNPQDISYKSSDKSKLIIGKNNTIREFCMINSGTNRGNNITTIGDNNLFMAYVHIAHDCVIGSNTIFANGVTLAGHVKVCSFTVIGGLTPIHQFVSIGEGVMIGGASAVSQDIPPFCLAEGNRAVVKSLNLVGIRRRFSKKQIESLERAYRVMFRGKEPIKNIAKKILSSECLDENVISLCTFILNTKRGIPYERKR